MLFRGLGPWFCEAAAASTSILPAALALAVMVNVAEAPSASAATVLRAARHDLGGLNRTRSGRVPGYSPDPNSFCSAALRGRSQTRARQAAIMAATTMMVNVAGVAPWWWWLRSK
jgi:hypothetical protein